MDILAQVKDVLISGIWTPVIFQPVLNGLMILCSLLFENFGLAILALTVIIRVLMLPLTLKQLRSSRAMSALQPKMTELRKKYSQDSQKLSAETSRLYKEYGVSPLGCLGPMLVQMPIWIAVFQSIRQALGTTPEGLANLQRLLYSWSLAHPAMPLNNHFLWLDLAQPDPYYILAIVVGVSMWVQQKQMTTPAADTKQASMNRVMQWVMPLMFGFWTVVFPSGLALYWAASTVIGIGLQHLITGWGMLPGPVPAQSESTQLKIPATAEADPRKNRRRGGKPRSKRKNRR